MSPIEETARLLAEQFAREREELDDFIAKAGAKGVEFATREEAARALRSKQFADKVATRRRALEEDARRNALLSEDVPPPLRVVTEDTLARDTWGRFLKAYGKAKRSPGGATRLTVAKVYDTSYETMRIHLRDKLDLDWRAARARAEAELD